MKKLLLILVLLLVSKFGFSQVGINTTTPNAQLDIKSSNQATPANNDGILIPKIDAFPLTNPTAAQNSMLVYLTVDLTGKPKGFYYWDNGTTSWIGLGSTQDADFYEIATTNPPDDINDNMFHIGNTSIGKNTSTYKLDVEETNNLKNRVVNITHSNVGGTTTVLRTAINSGALASGAMTGTQNAITLTNSVQGIGVSNDITGTSDDEVNGVRNTLTNSGIGIKRGIVNTFSGSGTGQVYGISNSFSVPSAITQRGLNNTFSGTPTGSSIGVSSTISDSGNGTKTGVENTITNSGTGIHYGIKNTISGSNALSEYAVYNEYAGTTNGNIQSVYNDINNSGNGFHYGAYNRLRSSGTGEHCGTYSDFTGTGIGKNYGNYNYFNTSANGTNDGVFNWMLGSGAGEHKGTYNWLGGSGNGLQYGVYNYVNNTGTGDKYGIYNYIFPTNPGVHYGVYSEAIKSNSYAGYFLGRMSIGTTIGNSYILPLSRGTVDQIMQTDGVGNVVWQNPNTALNSFAWTTTGNSGTNPATNFIGTTDDQPIIFKANNLQVGRLESGILKNVFFGGNTGTTNGGYYNVGIGYSVLNSLTTGNLNVGIGLSALRDNLDGFWNTAIGANAMTYNISGNNNVAFGYGALFLNETGSNNTANGFFSLEANKSGSGNVGFGNGTLYSNIAGSNGIAIGKDAMYYANSTLTPFENKNIAIGFESLKGSTTTANNTGNFNTAIGYQTLLTNTTGYGNTVAGSSSLLANTTGYNNSIFGASAMSNNTTGFGNTTLGDYILPRPTQGSNLTAMGYASLFYYGNNLTTVFTNTNTAIGYQSMLSEHFGSVPGTNNIGLNNSVVGYNSLQGNSSGSNNTAIGYQTMFLNKTGNNNVALGQETLNNNVLGSGNVALGYQSGFNEIGSNRLYIENSNSTTPLIYGEFDNDLVRINGKTEGIYTQLTANGDGQSSIYGFRTRDSQNDGTSYSRLGTNKATSGYNLWGDLYTFGVTGHNDNDFTRTGGILGAVTGGTYWSSLGYKNSAAVTYGVYATAALATGAGRLSQPQSQYSIGGGFYGGLIGSWSKGSMFGSINSGSLFASYNSGDEYTQGKQIEIVTTGNSKTAAYTVTSTEIVVYKKGRITLLNGSAKVTFDENYVKLLGDIPIVTASPMGQCNGIYIESIDKYGFIIKELNNGISNVSVSWISVGDRVDATDASTEVLNKDFDENINQVMFNDNNLNQSAKAMWSNGNTINFGKLPENLKEKLENK